MEKQSKVATLRALIRSGCVAMPGVPNAAFARQVERAGFSAVYLSGAGKMTRERLASFRKPFESASGELGSYRLP